MPTPYSDLFASFARIGVMSFGGPAAQISLMHRELVERRGWLDEGAFLRALSFCMLLPGPEAMQLASYAGWKLRGVAGGLLAGLLFVVPGAAVMMALAAGYAALGDLPAVAALFLGIKAAVVAVVLQALWRLSRKALAGATDRALAGLAFVALFAFAVPFPLVIAAAALWGWLRRPSPSGRGTALAPLAPARPRPLGRLAGTLALWGALWWLPVLALWLSGARFLTEIALFFSKLAVVTFGGAYAVLAYMAQEVVEARGWLDAPQMIDALGLAETTPGPLILVTQFVGYLAGHGAGGVGLALAAALVTLWVTFVPCFLWIFAGAPHVETLLARPRLRGACAAISAAVVGVILNLSVWFALHVLFSEVARGRFGPVISAPSLDGTAALLIALAAILLWLRRLPLPLVLALMAAISGATTVFI